jgi:hypothetical protein
VALGDAEHARAQPIQIDLAHLSAERNRGCQWLTTPHRANRVDRLATVGKVLECVSIGRDEPAIPIGLTARLEWLGNTDAIATRAQRRGQRAGDRRLTDSRIGAGD